MLPPSNNFYFKDSNKKKDTKHRTIDKKCSNENVPLYMNLLIQEEENKNFVNIKKSIRSSIDLTRESLSLNCDQCKTKMPNKTVSFVNKIKIIHVESYKKYNKSTPDQFSKKFKSSTFPSKLKMKENDDCVIF
jgi:hypothetical protein